jgi:hypothetical protein
MSHFYVFSTAPGAFHFSEKLTGNAVCHGRFTDREEAQAHAVQLRRNYLRPALDESGNPLTPAERARLGVWFPTLYAEALARGCKAQAKAKAVSA